MFELRIPEKKDDNLTNNKNGNVSLVNSTAKLNLISSTKKPGAMRYTKKGVKLSARVIIISKVITRRLKTNKCWQRKGCRRKKIYWYC